MTGHAASVLIWNITLKGVGSPYRKHVENIPLPYFEEIKSKRSDLCADFIDVRTELVQTMNPFIIQDQFRLARGETIKATVSKISAERLVRHAPTIFDLIHYYQKHKKDDTRVKMDDVDGQTVVVLKAKSIYELLTVKGGGAKMNAKEELKKLQETPFHLVYETESSKKGKVVKANTLRGLLEKVSHPSFISLILIRETEISLSGSTQPFSR